MFTGDTLLIRGTGRTDFQNGDPRAQYDSIFNKLLKLPDETLVYPAHDYKGDTVSTIGEEKAFNPRLQVKSVDEYVDLMNNLKLPNPKMMDVAVPANMHVGLAPGGDRAQGLGGVGGRGAGAASASRDVAFIDLREKSEREKHGVIPGLAARALSGLAGEHQRRRHAARTGRGDRQAAVVLLRLRRALGDGGAGGAGRRPHDRLPHRGRHRRLEEGRRRGRDSRPERPQCRIWLRNSFVRSCCGLSKNSSRRVHLDDLAVVHEDDAVGDLAGKAHLVGDAPAWSCRPRRARPWCRAPP